MMRCRPSGQYKKGQKTASGGKLLQKGKQDAISQGIYALAFADCKVLRAGGQQEYNIKEWEGSTPEGAG